MGKIAFVEVLDKRGNVRERVKIDSFPVTIGRGYANAVIVDDHLVGVEHLRLSLDSEGSIILEDLNTINGTWLSKFRKRIDRHRVPAGGEAVIRIGQTVLRLRGDDFPVGPAVSPRTLFGPFGRCFNNSAIAFMAFVAGFGLYVFVFAQEINKKIVWSDLTGMSLILLIAFVVWTGFWSFLSRLVVHSFHFMTHLAIASIASAFFLMLLTTFEYFEFIFSAPAAAEICQYTGFAVIFSLLLYGHLSVMSELSGGRRMFSSVLISAGIVGMVILISYTNRKEFSDELRFSSVMKPFGRTWVKTVPPEEFFGDLEKLRTKIDAMAQEGPKEKTLKE
jgi:hypothetical protein